MHVSPGVVAHYREKHGTQMDIGQAERLLPAVLANPLHVYQGKKRTTLIFVERYDGHYLLIVPVKCMPDHIWQETLYITDPASFEKRGWVRSGFLYAREG